MSDKKLLIEYREFTLTKEQLNENLSRKDGKFVVKGVLTRRDEKKNQNGRIYPKEVLEKEVENYKNTYLKENRALGELDHCDSSVINLKNVCHNIKDLYWDGDDLIGELEILTTPAGNIVRELFKCGVNVGISSRALGTVRNIDENTVEVQDDLSILCWDCVSAPSVRTAFIHPVNPISEGVTQVKNPINNKFEKIENIIRDILIETNK